MAINRTPVLKRCRQLGLDPVVLGYSSSKTSKREPKRRRKESEYGMQLREKQKVKFIYGVLEKQFHGYFEKAKAMPGITGENLMRILESRLDSVIFRLGFARTRKEARQIVTHGHIITVLATAKDGKKITKEMALAAFQKHPRIRVVSIDEGFKGNASFFKYARDLGNRRGDMYEIGLWEDSIVESGNDIMYAINIPQESVTIPETMDAIRAATGMQLTREEGTAMTNKYLGIGKFKTLG